MAPVLLKDRKSNDFVLVPRQKYEEFLDLEKTFKNKLVEIKDTDSAIKTYIKEKKRKKLRVLKSLTDLN